MTITRWRRASPNIGIYYGYAGARHVATVWREDAGGAEQWRWMTTGARASGVADSSDAAMLAAEAVV